MSEWAGEWWVGGWVGSVICLLIFGVEDLVRIILSDIEWADSRAFYWWFMLNAATL